MFEDLAVTHHQRTFKKQAVFYTFSCYKTLFIAITTCRRSISKC